MDDLTESHPEPVSRPWRPNVPPARTILTGLTVLVVSLTGAVVGLLLGSRTVVEVGPFHAQMSLAPSLTGDTSVFIPPLGSLHLDTHDGPAHLAIRLGALDQARTQALINDPSGITRVTRDVPDNLFSGAVRVALASLGAAVLGAMLLAALVFRNLRRVAWAGTLAMAVVGSSLGAAVATFRIDAVEEPRYEGLLVNAPALVGDVRRITDDYERYTEQLQSMVTNVTTLYTAASSLETFQPDASMTRVLHVSDLHLNPAAWSIMRTTVEQYDIDLIIDSGDIVDWGTGPETRYLDSIAEMGIPYVYVRGNHDSESLTQAAVAGQPNAIVLDDEVATVAGLTIAGIGDPRFTPDQRTGPFSGNEVRQQAVVDAGAKLATTVRGYGEPVDIAAVHDPIAAPPLEGMVPVVLSGHTHERNVVRLTPAAPEGADREPGPTVLMAQGSTGGAGLRGLEGVYPEPLALSVLYFDAERALVAYDDITVGGHGLSEVTLIRNLIDAPAEPGLLDGSPSPSPTG
jgi:predicted phosphodiesterase